MGEAIGESMGESMGEAMGEAACSGLSLSPGDCLTMFDDV